MHFCVDRLKSFYRPRLGVRWPELSTMLVLDVFAEKWSDFLCIVKALLKRSGCGRQGSALCAPPALVALFPGAHMAKILKPNGSRLLRVV
jgi:hypothetical protein